MLTPMNNLQQCVATFSPFLFDSLWVIKENKDFSAHSHNNPPVSWDDLRDHKLL